MEKLIFRKFFKDTISFFIISTLSISLIVWVIQAVNFLDFVSEDGHSFKVYFFYTLLSFPKIFARLMLFMFFLSVFYTIIKYEEKNELIIFWVNGVKKSVFLNFIVKFSIIIFFLQLFLNIFIVPKTQDLGRSFIRSSNIDYLPSLIKSKKFINAVEKLTIFIEKKDNDGNLINIFINDLNNVSISKTIFAKKGEIIKQDNNYYFILSNGNIIENSKNSVNIISFETTKVNLSNYSTKTTIHPKIQELSTRELFECSKSVNYYNVTYQSDKLICDAKGSKEVTKELYKRIINPFYIIIIAMVSSCLALRSENEIKFGRHKIMIFITCVTLIILSQILSQYSGQINSKNIIISFLPFLITIFSYLIIQYRLNRNLKNA